MINALRAHLDILTEPEGIRVLRRLRTEDVDCVLIIVNKRSFAEQIRLFREILTEDRKPPLLALVDPYLCLPNPQDYLAEGNLNGYAGGFLTSQDIVAFLSDIFMEKKPMLLAKERIGRKIWKRIRS